jgi:methyl-accepting chemotaxis protein
MAVLARERTVVDKAVADLFDILGPVDEQELAKPLVSELEAYRRAADAVASIAAEREALVQYHQRANPLLRKAVALTTVIRDRHFELARRAVTGAKDEASASRRAVLLITLAALGFAVLVAWHLTSRVVGPLRRLTRGANAIREGQFDERIEITSKDELGELASGSIRWRPTSRNFAARTSEKWYRRRTRSRPPLKPSRTRLFSLTAIVESCR